MISSSSSNNNKNEIILSKKFESKNNEVRAYYLEKLETDRNLGIKIDELVDIVHEQHTDWSLTKIAQYIVSVNEDLEKFSSQVIYDKMSEEKKSLYGKITKPKGKMLQNNVMEYEIVDEQSNVLEDSSSSSTDTTITTTRTLPTAYKVKDAETSERFRNELPRHVVKLAEKIELSPNKLKLITNPRLKEHPEIQKDLVKEIAPLPIDQAKLKVAQELRDLETGALFKSGKSYHVHTYLRDKIESNPEVEKSPHQYYFELMGDVMKFLYDITGHKIVKGGYEYTEKHIQYTKKHRIEMIKSLNERIVLALKADLEVVKSGINSMLDIIDKEVINNNNKKDDD